MARDAAKPQDESNIEASERGDSVRRRASGVPGCGLRAEDGRRTHRASARAVGPTPKPRSRIRIGGLRPAELVYRVALILLGSAIFTFGVHNIHEVVGITEGGVIGLVLFGDHWLGIPPSVVSPVLDAACYLLALRVLGRGFLGWSAVATVSVAGFYRIWEQLPHLLPDLSGSMFLAAVLGGLFVGIGVGIVIRQGSSAGGDDALALTISRLTGWRVGRCYLFTDLTVLVLSLSYIEPVKIACSLVTVTVSSVVIDLVKDASWDRVEFAAEALREHARRRRERPGRRSRG